MEDDFHDPLVSNLAVYPSLLSSAKRAILASPGTVLITVLLLPVCVIIATRLSSGEALVEVNGKGKNEKSVSKQSYWLMFIGHAYQLLTEPLEYMNNLRNENPHGIYALKLGGMTHNIVSDPELVTNVVAQENPNLAYESIALSMAQKFFGVPSSSLPKYREHGAKLTQQLTTHLLQEPALGKLRNSINQQLESAIPQMLSFLDTDIDLQPWERYADSTFISPTETEINLMSLMRDMMGNASIPVIFGHSLLEKYSDILHEVYTMDEGMWFFLMGLPSWFPWAKSVQAHRARQNVWRCMDDYQRALDASAKGVDLDSTWGNLEDVSELMLKRNEIYRDGNFGIKERGDTGILWALATKSNMLVYWNIIYILSTPDLLAQIRAETAPYITIHKPLSIGSFSEAPRLSISHTSLLTKCPLLKSCYLETLRLTSYAFSVRKIEADTTLSSPNATTPSFTLKAGEYLTTPHSLHMGDPKHFISPNDFIPNRFLITRGDGTRVVDLSMKGMRPYGGGESMCKGRDFAETACLAIVAGVLAYYDIEPSNKARGWVVPERGGRGGVAKPVGETRVRIRRRVFEWDDGEEKDG